MKVTRDPDFVPITITLETRKDLDELVEILAVIDDDPSLLIGGRRPDSLAVQLYDTLRTCQ